jgi:glycosyltransferase involved in cell wall biosynthesis
VVHFQWLTVQPLDVHLLPRRRPSVTEAAGHSPSTDSGDTPFARIPESDSIPVSTEAGRHSPADSIPVSTEAGRHSPSASIPVSASTRPKLVLTAHDVLPREPRPGQLAAQRRLYERFDAVVVHSEHGRGRLLELGVDPARVHVIPHGALAHLAAPGTTPRMGGQAEARVSEMDGPPSATDVPVVLFFGLLRPYKGLDVLLRAWREIGKGAELWIVGMPRMDVTRLMADAPPNVRFVPRFIPDAELPAYFTRADLVVLPYLEADQSGVLFTALAFGKPLLLSDVGGFPEIAATGAARTVPAGDSTALGEALRELLADPAARSAMAERARAAAAGPYSWDAIAQRTLELYRSLFARQPRVPSP